MAFKFSTGLRVQQCFGGSLKSVLNGTFLRLYSGPVPASPDDKLVGNDMLCEISAGGNPVTFEGSSGAPLLTKNLSEVWQGDVAVTGLATFFRLVHPSDTGENSTSEVRVQGTIGGPAADLTISNASLAQGAPQRVEFFAIELLETA